MILLISLWTIDIAISAIIIQQHTTETTIMLSNGFLIKDPFQAYHLGLWGVILAGFLLSAITLYTITRNIKETTI